MTKRIDFKTYTEYCVACKEAVKEGVFVSGTQDPVNKKYWLIVKEKDV